MALIAHWPLNGNTNDISGNKNNLINNGTTFVSNGKIGQAVDFDGSTTRSLTTTDGNFSTETFSISFWAFYDDYTYPKTTGAIKKSTGNTFSAGTIGWDFGHGYVASGVRTTINDGTNLIDTSVTFDEGYRPTDFINKWVHLSFIVDRNFKKVKYYVNGIKQSYELDISSITGTISSSNNLVFGTLYGWISDSRFNDLRLYNHALTDMEVQEIARAKILHYTFDDMQEPTTNLLQYPIDFSSWSKAANSGSLPTVTPNAEISPIGTFDASKLVIPNDGTYPRISSNFTPQDTNTHTISVYLKSALDNQQVTVAIFRNSPWSLPSITILDIQKEWTRHEIQFSPLDTTPHQVYIGSHDITKGMEMFIWGAQLEKKDHSTEFTPTSRTAKVNDYSGFFNHSGSLTEANTPRWTPEAKIGTGCYSFNYDLQDFIEMAYFTHDPQAVTLSTWVYSNDITKSQNIISRNGPYFLRITNSKLRIGVYTGTWLFVNGSITLESNKWYHLVLTYDGSFLRGYVNGVKDIESAKTGNLSASWSGTIRIGYTTGGEDAPMDGKIDDVRIYATALSDKDIKDLYEVRAEILNSGTLQTYDFKQRTNLLQSVNQAIKDKQFKDGLSAYTQANTNVTLTDSGYRIYRTPNVNPTDNGTTMWGGLRIDMTQIPGGIPLTKGRSYRLIINTNGKTSNSSNGSSKFSNQMGWGGGGLVPTPITIGREWVQIPNNFNGKHDIIWEFKIEDDIYKVCTTSYSSFVAGNTYPSYKDLQLGWSYQDTGSVGTEIYITGIHLYDITDDDSIGISNKGIGTFDEYSTVGITDGLVGYWPLNMNSKDYSGNNYNGTNYGSVPILDNSTYFNGAINNYIKLPNSTVTNLGDFTLSFFAKFTNITKPINTIFHATNAGGNDLSLEFYSNMILPVLSESYFSYSTTNLNNVWYHFVVKRSGSTVEVIKDNISLGVNTYPTTVYSITGAIILGHEQDAVGGGFEATQSFEGYLSNFKLFNRALTPEEIAIEYNTMFKNEVQIHESGVLYAKDLKQY